MRGDEDRCDEILARLGQWLHDLLPESRKQIDLFLIFRGFPSKKLAEIYKDCDSDVNEEVDCSTSSAMPSLLSCLLLGPLGKLLLLQDTEGGEKWEDLDVSVDHSVQDYVHTCEDEELYEDAEI